MKRRLSGCSCEKHVYSASVYARKTLWVIFGAYCRERRKQRFQELEGALNVLADQMNDKQTEVSDLWVGHDSCDDQ